VRLGVVLLLCGLSAAAQGSYCSFEVVVRDASGLPVAGVPVGIVEHGSQSATTWTDTMGIAKLCDGSFRAIDIVIGANSCASGIVHIKNVRPTWPRTRSVLAVFSPDPCDGIDLPNRCQLLLRIQDERGQPLLGAELEHPSASPRPDSSDEFGRMFASLKRGESFAGLVTRVGYKPEKIAAECGEGGTSIIEKKVTLKQK
jgi:hypothetical protein